MWWINEWIRLCESVWSSSGCKIWGNDLAMRWGWEESGRRNLEEFKE